MLVLIKYIITFYLIYYLVVKVGGSLLRTLTGSTGQAGSSKKQHSNSYQQTQKQKKEGISILKRNSSKKDKDNFKGGEYVDYEEVD